jgi:hypothetical protein
VRVDERDKIDVDLFQAPYCPTRRRSVLSGAWYRLPDLVLSLEELQGLRIVFWVPY